MSREDVMWLRSVAFAAAALLVAGSAACAKDRSINADNLRNPAAEGCCGEAAALAVNETGATPVDGYALTSLGQSGPAGEVKPGLDGADWNCKRPDGSRRCFAALPPSR
jgi:hypothetical protein